MGKTEDPVVTKSMIDEAVKTTVEDIAEIISDFSGQVAKRFDRLEKRQEKTEVENHSIRTDIKAMKIEMKAFNYNYEHLLKAIDDFMKRLDDQEIDNIARDSQLERHDRWHHQAADKIGLKLR